MSVFYCIVFLYFFFAINNWFCLTPPPAYSVPHLPPYSFTVIRRCKTPLPEFPVSKLKLCLNSATVNKKLVLWTIVNKTELAEFQLRKGQMIHQNSVPSCVWLFALTCIEPLSQRRNLDGKTATCVSELLDKNICTTYVCTKQGELSSTFIQMQAAEQVWEQVKSCVLLRPSQCTKGLKLMGFTSEWLNLHF